MVKSHFAPLNTDWMVKLLNLFYELSVVAAVMKIVSTWVSVVIVAWGLLSFVYYLYSSVQHWWHSFPLRLQMPLHWGEKYGEFLIRVTWSILKKKDVWGREGNHVTVFRHQQSPLRMTDPHLCPLSCRCGRWAWGLLIICYFTILIHSNLMASPLRP